MFSTHSIPVAAGPHSQMGPVRRGRKAAEGALSGRRACLGGSHSPQTRWGRASRGLGSKSYEISPESGPVTGLSTQHPCLPELLPHMFKQPYLLPRVHLPHQGGATAAAFLFPEKREAKE